VRYSAVVKKMEIIAVDHPGPNPPIASPLERALLLDRRGGVGEERCVRQDCAQLVLKGLAFCLDHTFERGVRK